MGKMIENPKYNIVSLRLSDYEHELMRMAGSMYGLTTSELLRTALFTYISRQLVPEVVVVPEVGHG